MSVYYRITLFARDGSVQEERTAIYPDDDKALEQVGWLSHRHKIQVHQGERLVGEFQPVFEAGFRRS